MTINDITLVTGTNKGLGREIVRQLAARGMTVYLGARDQERGQQASAAPAGNGDDVRFVRLHVTVPESVAATVSTIRTECGRLAVLVDNAGIAVEVDTAVAVITASQLRETNEVNVHGAVTVTSAWIPRCCASQPTAGS